MKKPITLFPVILILIILLSSSPTILSQENEEEWDFIPIHLSSSDCIITRTAIASIGNNSWAVVYPSGCGDSTHGRVLAEVGAGDSIASTVSTRNTNEHDVTRLLVSDPPNAGKYLLWCSIDPGGQNNNMFVGAFNSDLSTIRQGFTPGSAQTSGRCSMDVEAVSGGDITRYFTLKRNTFAEIEYRPLNSNFDTFLDQDSYFTTSPTMQWGNAASYIFRAHTVPDNDFRMIYMATSSSGDRAAYLLICAWSSGKLCDSGTKFSTLLIPNPNDFGITTFSAGENSPFALSDNITWARNTVDEFGTHFFEVGTIDEWTSTTSVSSQDSWFIGDDEITALGVDDSYSFHRPCVFHHRPIEGNVNTITFATWRVFNDNDAMILGVLSRDGGETWGSVNKITTLADWEGYSDIQVPVTDYCSYDHITNRASVLFQATHPSSDPTPRLHVGIIDNAAGNAGGVGEFVGTGQGSLEGGGGPPFNGNGNGNGVTPTPPGHSAPGVTFFGLPLQPVADGFGEDVRSISWLAGIFLMLLLMSAMGVAWGLVGIVLGALVGLVVSFVIGMFPEWFLLLIIFVVIILGVVLFRGRGEE